jgi:hypothetical protein
VRVHTVHCSDSTNQLRSSWENLYSWQQSGVLGTGYPFVRNSAEKKMKNTPGRKKTLLADVEAKKIRKVV